MRSCGRCCSDMLLGLRRCLNAFAVGELLFFAGPKKSNQKKGPSAQEHTLHGCGQSRFSDSPSMARSENGARPARRPPGLDAHGNPKIISGKSDNMFGVGVRLPSFLPLTLKMPIARGWLTTRRAAPMDGRRFRSSHGWRVRKWSSDSPAKVSPDRGSALSFGYFSLGACKEK